MAIDLTILIKRALTRKRLRGFMGNEAGVTAVEFGLLAVPFFAILGAILETAVVFLAGQLLDSAVQDASRYVRTGQMQAASYNLKQFRDNVCGRLYGLFVCDDLFVDVQPLSSFTAVNIKAPVNASCKTKAECALWTRDPTYQPGLGSSIMVVQVYYRWPVILNLGGFNMSNMPSGERILGAAAVFRNEPFTGSSS
nr:TadE/TadG family type IV pilus assembly protein [uncultured Devosia sp.]